MRNPKTLGLINALVANLADTPARPQTLSALSRGLLGLDRGPGALSSFHAPQPRLRDALEQFFADSEHDQLVKKLHARLVANLFSDIKVDLPGYAKPQRIVWTDTQRGHEPDASAYYGLKQHIFEVETADSIADEHTRPPMRVVRCLRAGQVRSVHLGRADRLASNGLSATIVLGSSRCNSRDLVFPRLVPSLFVL